jgi:hypothetical protein
MIKNLHDLVRTVVLAEAGGGSGFWVKSGSRRILDFPKLRPYFMRLSPRPTGGAMTMLEEQLHTFEHDAFYQYDSLIIQACSDVGIKPSLFKAMALLESKLGARMKGEDSQKGFIHMTRATYSGYFDESVGFEERERIMLSPEESIPVCARHVRHLIDELKTPEAVIFAVKNGEFKTAKATKGLSAKDAAEKKTSMYRDSDYTQASLALRQMFGKDGLMPVGRRS